MVPVASQTAPEVTVSIIERPIGQIRVVEGIEYIFDACTRCDGSGYYGPIVVDGGVCFKCRYFDRKLRILIGAGGFWVEKKISDRRAKARARYAANREVREAKKQAKIDAAIAELVEVHPLLAELTYFNVDGIAGHSTFLAELGGKLRQYGTLSERQIVVAERIIREEIAKQAKRDAVAAAKRAAEAAKPELTPVPEGRFVLKGIVDGFWTKRGHDYYGRPVASEKMWIVDAEGHRVSVGIPSGLDLVEVGTELQLTVTVQRDKREAHKGWGSRPAKVTVLS